jgi:hypothetical protein
VVCRKRQENHQQCCQAERSDSVAVEPEPLENIRKRKLSERHVQSLQQRDLGFRPESAVDRFYLGNTLFIELKAGKSANVPR